METLRIQRVLRQGMSLTQLKELTKKEVGLYFKDHFFCGIMFRLLFDEEKLEDLLSIMSIKKLEFWLEEIK